MQNRLEEGYQDGYGMVERIEIFNLKTGSNDMVTLTIGKLPTRLLSLTPYYS